jgi:hypothetical protein
MKHFTTISLLFAFIAPTFSQNKIADNKSPKIAVEKRENDLHKKNTTFSELPDPSPNTTANWSAVKGLQASFVPKYIRFNKSSIPMVSKTIKWKGAGWRGERLSAQLAVWSADPVDQLEFKFSDFRGTNGVKLPAAIAKVRFERFVLTDDYGIGCDEIIRETDPVSLVADMLDTLGAFNMEAKTVRPVWLSINVPADAQPGVYETQLTMFAARKKHSTFKLKIEVLPQTLPAPSEWAFHLDLWQNPYAVARIHQVEPWSDKHWDYLKPMMQLLASAGQKVITTTINKDPWGGQTYDPYGSMIIWTKLSDGSWQYDYSIFDKWVSFMFKQGIGKQINCYSMVSWGNQFYYFDKNQNQEVKIQAVPGTKEYSELWTPFLQDFKNHLKEKGWLEKTRIAMDERAPEEMKAALELLSDIAPEIGVSLADSHKSYRLYKDQLKDVALLFGSPVDTTDLLYRRNHGMKTTYYICCMPEFPGIHTFSPPAEGVMIGWYASAVGLDGFLYWAFNSWVKDPLTDSRFRKWPAGDCYIVYPDARSSIRFETLREGIQDTEKIRLLRKKFLDNGEKDKLELLNSAVSQFNISQRPKDLGEMIDKAKSVINSLSK